MYKIAGKTLAAKLDRNNEYPTLAEMKEAMIAVEKATVEEAAPHLLKKKLFPFMDLPVEIRGKIYHEYFLAERDLWTFNRCIHYDCWGQPCCVWKYPKELILCDKYHTDDLPNLARPTWLPPLAGVNIALRNEVTNFLLRGTKTITIKYYSGAPVKILPWLGKFLKSLTGEDGLSGFNAVHSLNFPHIHRMINSTEDLVPFMQGCPKLWNVSMTWHFKSLLSMGCDGSEWELKLDAFLKQWKLEGIVNCGELKRLDFDVIQGKYQQSTFSTLKDFAKSLHEGFQEKGKDIEVRLYERMAVFNGTVGNGVLI
jgi:hypothetical protein